MICIYPDGSERTKEDAIEFESRIYSFGKRVIEALKKLVSTFKKIWNSIRETIRKIPILYSALERNTKVKRWRNKVKRFKHQVTDRRPARRLARCNL